VPTNNSAPAKTLFRWSLSSNRYPLADYSAAKVVMTLDGEKLKVSKERYQTGSGDNTLVWTAKRDSGKFLRGKRAVIRVKVSNIRVGTRTLSHSYTVRPFPLGPPNAPKVPNPSTTGGTLHTSWLAAKANGTPVTGYRVKLMRFPITGGTPAHVSTGTFAADQRNTTFSGHRGWCYFGAVEARSKAGWSPEGWPGQAACFR
jgi:hypothetical protein